MPGERPVNKAHQGLVRPGLRRAADGCGAQLQPTGNVPECEHETVLRSQYNGCDVLCVHREARTRLSISHNALAVSASSPPKRLRITGGLNIAEHVPSIMCLHCGRQTGRVFGLRRERLRVCRGCRATQPGLFRPRKVYAKRVGFPRPACRGETMLTDF